MSVSCQVSLYTQCYNGTWVAWLGHKIWHNKFNSLSDDAEYLRSVIFHWSIVCGTLIGSIWSCVGARCSSLIWSKRPLTWMSSRCSNYIWYHCCVSLNADPAYSSYSFFPWLQPWKTGQNLDILRINSAGLWAARRSHCIHSILRSQYYNMSTLGCHSIEWRFATHVNSCYYFLFGWDANRCHGIRWLCQSSHGSL
jgi:hypothetical protein